MITDEVIYASYSFPKCVFSFCIRFCFNIWWMFLFFKLIFGLRTFLGVLKSVISSSNVNINLHVYGLYNLLFFEVYFIGSFNISFCLTCFKRMLNLFVYWTITYFLVVFYVLIVYQINLWQVFGFVKWIHIKKISFGQE